MAIKIPFLNKPKDGGPTRDCVYRAVRELGVDDFLVAKVMTYFLEELTNQVAKGRLVRIPGFGVFGARLSKPKTRHSNRQEKTPPTAYPSFSPSKAFRNMVALCCPLDPIIERQMSGHQRRNNLGHPGKDTSMPFTAFDSWRKSLRAQERKEGREESRED